MSLEETSQVPLSHVDKGEIKTSQSAGRYTISEKDERIIPPKNVTAFLRVTTESRREGAHVVDQEVSVACFRTRSTAVLQLCV